MSDRIARNDTRDLRRPFGLPLRNTAAASVLHGYEYWIDGESLDVSHLVKRIRQEGTL